MINRNSERSFSFRRGNTYYFDQSLESNSGCALKFSATKNGTHGGGIEYAEGVGSRSRPGKRGAYTRITVPATAPGTLYYYCARHSDSAGDAAITVVGPGND